MAPVPDLPDAALRQLRGAVAHCLHEADHLPEGSLLSQRWSIDAFDALRRFEALDDLITRHRRLPTDWNPRGPSPTVPQQHGARIPPDRATDRDDPSPAPTTETRDSS